MLCRTLPHWCNEQIIRNINAPIWVYSTILVLAPSLLCVMNMFDFSIVKEIDAIHVLIEFSQILDINGSNLAAIVAVEYPTSVVVRTDLKKV